uniref:Uncharacterized protein n=1 Tax=Oryza brachyantha TaxID=4533 RepID=J3NAJ8_ORYBR
MEEEKSLQHTYDLRVTGKVEYNGVNLNTFVPDKTSAYISKYDLHIPEMTVRETLDFSARFQGVGTRAKIMKEVIKREKEAGITPDPDIDTYMKIMGLDICADIIVGDVMRRGISGGEKKRLTTGEMIVGPSRALFMDEISTGLDSSTTFQIVSCLQQLCHISESTILVSLLQPAPETYELFDDIILMAEGKIVYHGSKNCTMNFFESCGFKCPQRKGAAGFLQEVQNDFFSIKNIVDHFCEKFRASQDAQNLATEISKPHDTSEGRKNDLSFNVYSLSKWDLLKACFAREILLMRRNAFIYITKSVQVFLTTLYPIPRPHWSIIIVLMCCIILPNDGGCFQHLFSVPILPPDVAMLRRKPLLMDADVDGMFGELCTATKGNAKISTTEFISSRTPFFPPRPVQAANALRCISHTQHNHHEGRTDLVDQHYINRVLHYHQIAKASAMYVLLLYEETMQGQFHTEDLLCPPFSSERDDSASIADAQCGWRQLLTVSSTEERCARTESRERCFFWELVKIIGAEEFPSDFKHVAIVASARQQCTTRSQGLNSLHF